MGSPGLGQFVVVMAGFEQAMAASTRSEERERGSREVRVCVLCADWEGPEGHACTGSSRTKRENYRCVCKRHV
jgi:hypothetical protein